MYDEILQDLKDILYIFLHIFILWSSDDDPKGSKHVGKQLYNKISCAFVGVLIDILWKCTE